MTLYISAPFGNYYNHPKAISIVGTFTLEPRAGFFTKWFKVLKTVRPYPGGWINKLELPNAGITTAPRPHYNKVISLYGGWSLVEKAYKLGWRKIELNLSCPNADPTTLSVVTDIMKYARPLPLTIIAKISPVKPMRVVDHCIQEGIANFHLCNSIPTPNGGISGAGLKPFSLWAVEEVRHKYPNAHIIGGGGIGCEADAYDYMMAGANDIAVGSALFNIFKARRLINDLIRTME